MGKTKPTIKKSLGSLYFKTTAEMLLKGLAKDTGCWEVDRIARYSQDLVGRGTHGIKKDRSFISFSYPQIHCPLILRNLHIIKAGIKGWNVAKGTGYVGKKQAEKKTDQQGTVFLVGT